MLQLPSAAHRAHFLVTVRDRQGASNARAVPLQLPPSYHRLRRLAAPKQLLIDWEAAQKPCNILAPPMSLTIAPLLVVALLSGQAPPQSPKATNPATNQRTSVAAPAPPLTSAPATTQGSQGAANPNTGASNSERQKLYGWLLKWLEPQNFASLLLFIAGVVGSIIAIVTLRTIQTQNRVALLNAKIGRRAANAAKQSADASVKTADATEQAMITSTRAFVTFDRFETANVADSEGRIAGVVVTPVVTNTGRSPALQCFVTTGKEIVPVMVPGSPHPHPREPFQHNPRIAAIVMGQASPSRCSPVHITTAEMDDIIAERTNIFVHVYVEYRDVFADTPIRTMSNCSAISVRRDYRAVAPNQPMVDTPTGRHDHNHAD